MYDYAATLDHVHDGDTVFVNLDLGFSTWIMNADLRLDGLNCPELGTPAGEAAKQFVIAQFGAHPSFTVQTRRDVTHVDPKEKYGRYLATIVWPDGSTLNASLILTGHAAPWDGQGPKPVPGA